IDDLRLAELLDLIEVRLEVEVVVVGDGDLHAAHRWIAALRILPIRSACGIPARRARITRSLLMGCTPGSGLTSTKLATPLRSRRTSMRATSRNPNARQT